MKKCYDYKAPRSCIIAGEERSLEEIAVIEAACEGGVAYMTSPLPRVRHDVKRGLSLWGREVFTRFYSTAGGSTVMWLQKYSFVRLYVNTALSARSCDSGLTIRASSLIIQPWRPRTLLIVLPKAVDQ